MNPVTIANLIASFATVTTEVVGELLAENRKLQQAVTSLTEVNAELARRVELGLQEISRLKAELAVYRTPDTP